MRLQYAHIRSFAYSGSLQNLLGTCCSGTSSNVCVANGSLWQRISYHKGSNESKQLLSSVFNAIHSDQDTVKQW